VSSESHKTDAGFVAEKLYKPSDSMIVLYVAEEQGLNTGGKYAVVCSAHGNLIGDRSLQRAKQSMREPSRFCPDCYDAAVTAGIKLASRVVQRYLTGSIGGGTRGPVITSERHMREVAFKLLRMNQGRWAWLDGFQEPHLQALAGIVASALWKQQIKDNRGRKRLRLPESFMGEDELALYMPAQSRLYAGLAAPMG
jgi:hypothetical protein